MVHMYKFILHHKTFEKILEFCLDTAENILFILDPEI